MHRTNIVKVKITWLEGLALWLRKLTGLLVYERSFMIAETEWRLIIPSDFVTKCLLQ